MVRGLLVRGMLAGLAAGIIAFAFAWVIGEPQVNLAIAFEDHMHHMAGDAPEPELVSRAVQSTIGLGDRRLGLWRGARRDFRARFRLCAGADGAARTARDRGGAGGFRVRDVDPRAADQISGEPAVDRCSRHDRVADGALFHDDRAVGDRGRRGGLDRAPTRPAARRVECGDRGRRGLSRRDRRRDADPAARSTRCRRIFRL